MDNNPDQARSWQDRDDDPDRAVTELRDGIERVRQELRTLRDALFHEPREPSDA